MEPIIRDTVDYVMAFAVGTDNWLSVKKEILWRLSKERRKLFSRRHYSSKKHTLNNFELEIINYWKRNTGILLSIPENMRHDPTWIRRRPGWGLRKYNQIRTLAAEKRKKDEQAKPKKTS